MIEIIGWLSTLLVLIGFYTNSIGKLKTSLILWIIGDIFWIAYDVMIDNYSHLTLSILIIFINAYGLYNLKLKKND